MNTTCSRDGVGALGLYRGARRLSRFGLIACLVLLAGCSSLDPRNLFGREPPEAEAAAVETRAAGEREVEATADEPYPNLAQVPARPRVRKPSVRERVTEGLIADRENARYTADAIERQSELSAVPLPSIPTRPATAPPPTPPAQMASTAPPAPLPKPQSTVTPEKAFPPSEDVSSAAGRTPSEPPQPVPPDLGPAVWVATIQFGHGSARLDERDLGVLQQVVEVWEQLGGRLRVVGHASGRAGGRDRIKQQMANFEASLARANVVAQTLMGLGIGPSDVIVEAQSDREPLYRETTPVGEAGNRRTEIFIVR